MRHCYLADFDAVLLSPIWSGPVADADKTALLIRAIYRPQPEQNSSILRLSTTAQRGASIAVGLY